MCWLCPHWGAGYDLLGKISGSSIQYQQTFFLQKLTLQVGDANPERESEVLKAFEPERVPSHLCLICGS